MPGNPGRLEGKVQAVGQRAGQSPNRNAAMVYSSSGPPRVWTSSGVGPCTLHRWATSDCGPHGDGLVPRADSGMGVGGRCQTGVYEARVCSALRLWERLGYGSIGCTHCTEQGEGREGRWKGSGKTECGLHPGYFDRKTT